MPIEESNQLNYSFYQRYFPFMLCGIYIVRQTFSPLSLIISSEYDVADHVAVSVCVCLCQQCVDELYAYVTRLTEKETEKKLNTK